MKTTALAGAIRATHPDFRYQPIAASEELVNAAGEFQIGEVCFYFILNDFSSAELDHTRVSDGTSRQARAGEPLVFDLIEPQESLALGF